MPKYIKNLQEYHLHEEEQHQPQIIFLSCESTTVESTQKGVINLKTQVFPFTFHRIINATKEPKNNM